MELVQSESPSWSPMLQEIDTGVCQDPADNLTVTTLSAGDAGTPRHAGRAWMTAQHCFVRLVLPDVRNDKNVQDNLQSLTAQVPAGLLVWPGHCSQDLPLLLYMCRFCPGATE